MTSALCCSGPRLWRPDLQRLEQLGAHPVSFSSLPPHVVPGHLCVLSGLRFVAASGQLDFILSDSGLLEEVARD